MVSLGRRYVQYINKSYQRTGTLWDGRYKSSLVQAQDYLLLCHRYIELNPVRAAMVADPACYRWSSHRANGLGQTDSLLTPHAIYETLGHTAQLRCEAYRALFSSAFDDEAITDVRLATQQGQPLGNGRFLDTIQRMTGQRREANGKQKRFIPSRVGRFSYGVMGLVRGMLGYMRNPTYGVGWRWMLLYGQSSGRCTYPCLTGLLWIYCTWLAKSASLRIRCSQNRRCQMACSCLSARLPHTAGRSSAGTLAVNPRLMLRHRVE